MPVPFFYYSPERKDLYALKSGPTEMNTRGAEIKRTVTVHLRENRETLLHHIFINMLPK